MTAECGTAAAYQQHRLAGEKPCDPCKAANTKYHRRYKGIGRNVARKIPVDDDFGITRGELERYRGGL